MPSRQPPPPLPPPPPPVPGRCHSVAVVAGAGAAGAGAVAVLVVVALLWWLRRRRRGKGKGEANEVVAVAERLQRLSYRKLRRATGGFAAGSKLGQGGFGPVFRGALPPMTTAASCGGAGRPVAVKVMDAAGSLQGEREFHNEIAVASHLIASSSAPGSPPVPDAAAAKPGGKGRDSILLPFAYSMSSVAQGEGRPRRMMLVYDLMPHGSLQDALLGRRCPELVAEWPRRLAVARDVAAALHYLHSVVKPPVVHGDVKPNNVLLDTDLRARLADFGLSRINSDVDADGKPESGAIAEGCDVDGNVDGGCDDFASVIAESTVTTTMNGEGNPKSPEDDDGFTSASPAEAGILGPLTDAYRVSLSLLTRFPLLHSEWHRRKPPC